ncbi:MAG: hypothetical protein IJ151_09075 [Bacteroidales bacterium]|nr:hypothetical protein [Bacteroidales bacterium]MBQ9186002.1 hypothetical protein [Bacteroidales bacterium]
MRFIKMMAFALVAMIAAASCGQKKEAPKVLVLYYSQSDNTKAVAQEISTALGADLEEIVPVEPYNGTYDETIQRCIREREEEILPKIQPVLADVSAYDVVFIGYPIWFGTCALPMLTCLGEIDLSGKKVVPFCTFGSGGLFSSAADIANRQPEAEMLPGYGVRAARMKAMPEEVDQFLKANGFLEGDYVKLEEFPETHAVSEEESAIFDAAVEGYSMLSATASKVASRKIPGGTEYQFIALTAPRQATPESKMVEITVYVTVKDGEAPVFTQVVR